MDPMEPNLGKIEAQLKHWGAKLDGFVAKAEKAGAQAKDDYRKRIDELKAKLDSAQSKLSEFKAAGGERWEHFKSGVDKAFKDLEDAFKGRKP